MVHIRRLREKMNEPPRKPKYIKTVWGSGYRFVTQNGFVEEESDDRRS